MPFTFDHPALLSLLLLAVPIVWLGVRELTVLEKPRRWVALVLRCAVLTLLVLMLAGLRTQRTHDDLTVIAVVDRSASIRTFGRMPSAQPGNGSDTQSTDTALLSFLRSAAGDRRPEDRLGLVTYDGRPSVRLRPASRDSLDAATIDDPRDGTDTAAAINHALAAQADGDTALRITLATDGNDTAGDLLAAARAAAAAGVEIDVLPVPYDVGREVMVEGVYAPAEAREGQTIAVRVVLRATSPAAGTVELMRDDALLDLDPAPDRTGIAVTRSQWTRTRNDAPPPGDNTDADTAAPPTAASSATDYILALTLDVPMTDAGPSSFTAVFEPDGIDTRAARQAGRTGDLAVNNRAQGFTQVAGKGKFLFVDQLGGAPGRILPDTLRSRGLELEIIAPDRFPTSLTALQRYDGVIFQNVPADDIRPFQQRQLVRYVKELGGGFVMIGGPDSFGAGGWTGSDIDNELLPVDCEIPSQTILPTGALVLVLDRSGSMASPVGNTGASQMELAAEAAALAVQTLYPQDMIGVVAFDHSAKWVVPLQPNADPGEVQRLLRSVEPDGGTDIYAGLLAAFQSLSDPRAQVQDQAIRHVILLTDGQSEGPFEALVNDMRRQGITLSTIGVGDGHEQQRLQQLAYLGDGEYHEIIDPQQLPQVFIKEARNIRKNLIKEATFAPQPVNTGSPITSGITFNEPLRGLVLTGPRYDRRVDMPLLGPEGEPLFAHGPVGLGRVAAFTSDATNRWAVPWLTWDGYVDFWTRTARTIGRPTASRNADLLTTFDGDSLKLTLNTYAEDAAQAGPERSEGPGPPNQTGGVRGGVLMPDGTIAQVTLEQTGPGRYEATLPATDDGNYIASLYLTDEAGEQSAVFGGASRPPGEELRRFTPNHDLLKQVAQITGGRVLNPTDPTAAPLFERTKPFTTVSSRPLRWLLMPWLLALVMLDVANRRIAWDAAAIAGWVKSHVKPTRQDAQQRETLAALKSRKARTTHGQPATTQTTAQAVAEEPRDEASEQPTQPRPDPQRKFVASPQARASSDFAEAVGGATLHDKDTAARASSKDDDDGSTTSRLLAARRRTQRDEGNES